MAGILLNHKFKIIMFSKILGLEVFKAKLESPYKFNILKPFSILNFIPYLGLVTPSTLTLIIL